MTAAVAQVRSGFATLRHLTDPRGHDLLDELERTAVFALQGCECFADALERLRDGRYGDSVEERLAAYGHHAERVQHLRIVKETA